MDRRITSALGVVGAVLLIALTALVPSASAHFDTSGQYTHAGPPCPNNDRIDPINVVFYSWGTWARAENQVAMHAVWWYGDGSSQFFYDHSNCNLMQTQRASGDIFSSRYHIRIRSEQDSDASLGWTALGDAHHEDLVVPCGHAVDKNGANGSGFDQGRNQLSNAMSMGGHYYYFAWWGNTQSFVQCDGDAASSDGAVSFIQLHQTNH